MGIFNTLLALGTSSEFVDFLDDLDNYSPELSTTEFSFLVNFMIFRGYYDSLKALFSHYDDLCKVKNIENYRHNLALVDSKVATVSYVKSTLQLLYTYIKYVYVDSIINLYKIPADKISLFEIILKFNPNNYFNIDTICLRYNCHDAANILASISESSNLNRISTSTLKKISRKESFDELEPYLNLSKEQIKLIR